jgi:hypothetical protein
MSLKISPGRDHYFLGDHFRNISNNFFLKETQFYICIITFLNSTDFRLPMGFETTCYPSKPPKVVNQKSPFYGSLKML